MNQIFLPWGKLFHAAKKGPQLWLMTAVVVLLAAGCSTGRPDPTPSPEATRASAPPSPTTLAAQAEDGPTLAPSPPATVDEVATPAARLDPSPAPSPTQPLSTSEAPSPTPIATPTESPTPSPGGDSPHVPAALHGRYFPSAPDRDLYELARSLLKVSGPIPRVVNPEPVSYQAGRTDTFSVIDIAAIEQYTVSATLRLVSPHAYWYVEDGIGVSQDDLEQSAQTFENVIYPRVTETFGTEWTPGVDNDPHMTVLNARIRGVGGYFSSMDQYPTSVHPFSNEREMIYINVSGLKVGSRSYAGVLTHEFHHAVHANNDGSDETWVNEGLSELASSLAGYTTFSRNAFLQSPATSLVNWPLVQLRATHYGGDFLFFDYLAGHYGTKSDLMKLEREPLDGIEGIDAFLAKLGYDVTFDDVFKDWVIANYLDLPGDGPYSYPDSDLKVMVTSRIGGFDQLDSTLPQYAAEYTAIDITKGDIRLGFTGQKENRLLPVSVDGACWWSNRGDAISSTLTRRLNLSGTTSATLKYRTAFHLEEDWDYAYLQVSTDGGATWDIIQAPGTSPGNPVGNSYGPGYTGTSDGWLEETVNLDRYAGSDVLLRFHYVTDEAINGTGICFDDISVPEIGFHDGVDTGVDSGWQPEGFVQIDNRVPQQYLVQVIQVGKDVQVRDMVLDEENRGELLIKGLEELDEVVVVVAALAPKTMQAAAYTLSVTSAGP